MKYQQRKTQVGQKKKTQRQSRLVLAKPTVVVDKPQMKDVIECTFLGKAMEKSLDDYMKKIKRYMVLESYSIKSPKGILNNGKMSS